eukprot:SAG11_NODE_1215_length_5501_cov_4.190820_5_plen_57_part_00
MCQQRQGKTRMHGDVRRDVSAHSLLEIQPKRDATGAGAALLPLLPTHLTSVIAFIA